MSHAALVGVRALLATGGRRAVRRGAAILICAIGVAASGSATGATDLAEIRRAAESGDAASEYRLGRAYACGWLVARDRAEALGWFARSADHGYAPAQAALGWMYFTGSGVPRDDRRAVEWLRRGAEGGVASAQNNLGIAYATGRGVARDTAEAERWFRAAADQGAEDAARNLDKLHGRPASGSPKMEAPRAAPGRATQTPTYSTPICD
ncbi:MAG: sel1 repeat family protein [Burkholderiales bacterium]|jgi:hypothetical protein|nr:sel1 repeat family protein [Burkholderiales bacterium]